MEPLTERYARYLEAKEGDIELCEYFTFEEYNILYEEGYRDLEKKKSKALKYGTAAALGAGAMLAIPGLGPLAPIAAALFMALLKKYRLMTDKCVKRCAGLIKSRTATGPEFALCRSKCNYTAAEGMLGELESKRKALLAKAKDDKQKAAINKKFDKKGDFFRDKMQKANQMIKDYEGAMRGKSER